jgi:hypothetical protein
MILGEMLLELKEVCARPIWTWVKNPNQVTYQGAFGSTKHWFIPVLGFKLKLLKEQRRVRSTIHRAGSRFGVVGFGKEVRTFGFSICVPGSTVDRVDPFECE